MAATDTRRPVALGRRERKKLETRRALRDSALRLFAEHGYGQTTIEDIAEAADVAPRTFFLHFTSKEDVLVGGPHQEELERFRVALAARPDGEDPLRTVRAAIRGLPSFATPDRDELLLRTRLAKEAPVLIARTLERYAAFEQAISEAVAQRLTSRTHSQDDADTASGIALYAELLGATAMGALRVALAAWCRQDGTVPIEDLFDEAFDRIGAGLSRPSG